MLASAQGFLRAAFRRGTAVAVIVGLSVGVVMGVLTLRNEVREVQKELYWVEARLADKRELVQRQRNEITRLASEVDRVARVATGAGDRAAQLRRAAHLEESREPEGFPIRLESVPDGGAPIFSPEGARALEQLGRLQSQASSLNESVVLLTALMRQGAAGVGGKPSRWPVRGDVSSHFGYRSSPIGSGGDFHPGMDIRAPYGTPVMTTAAGQVVFAGHLSGYGATVVVDHGHDVKTLYGHLSTLYVREGRALKRGDVVGAVGRTGRATGPHLHYEVRLGGEPVDPTCWLASAAPRKAASLTDAW